MNNNKEMEQYELDIQIIGRIIRNVATLWKAKAINKLISTIDTIKNKRKIKSIFLEASNDKYDKLKKVSDKEEIMHLICISAKITETDIAFVKERNFTYLEMLDEKCRLNEINENQYLSYCEGLKMDDKLSDYIIDLKENFLEKQSQTFWDGSSLKVITFDKSCFENIQGVCR